MYLLFITYLLRIYYVFTTYLLRIFYVLSIYRLFSNGRFTIYGFEN